jgi:hypothetical protein
VFTSENLGVPIKIEKFRYDEWIKSLFFRYDERRLSRRDAPAAD